MHAGLNGARAWTWGPSSTKSSMTKAAARAARDVPTIAGHQVKPPARLIR